MVLGGLIGEQVSERSIVIPGEGLLRLFVINREMLQAPRV